MTPCGRAPPWAADLPERPTVYMTLGRVLNTHTSVLRAALDGLAGAPVNLVIPARRAPR
ncbi:MAG TPA: hypothetical protein VLW50_29510 [Streptosporangiaceae bacterium]|nr:hypothetical protein [Streptosporangiaceae bacterium]